MFLLIYFLCGIMAKTTMLTNGLPGTVGKALERIGENLKLARKKRGITMGQMAERAFVSRQTIAKLERGHPGVSFGNYAVVAYILGLDKQLENLFAPQSDELGYLLDKERFGI